MPPVPTDIVRVSLRGTLGSSASGLEEFNHGFYLHLDDRTTPGIARNQAMVDLVASKVRDKWASAFSVLAPRFPASVKYTEVRAYHLDNTTGLTLHKSTSAFSGSVVGAAATSLPAECATCVTIHAYTDSEALTKSQAARRRGRMYLPPLATGNTDADGRMTTSCRTALLSGIDVFFEDVQGMQAHADPAIDAHWDVVVVSRADVAFHQVESYGIGLVIDVQRRRRVKELEERLFTTLDHE